MDPTINVYRGAGDGLRANPQLEGISNNLPVIGAHSCLDRKLKVASYIATNNARNLLLIRAHLLGVDFFTYRNNEGSLITTVFGGKREYYVSHVESCLGHVGQFKNPLEQLEKRKQQVEIARELIPLLLGYSEKESNFLYKSVEIVQEKMRGYKREL